MFCKRKLLVMHKNRKKHQGELKKKTDANERKTYFQKALAELVIAKPADPYQFLIDAFSRKESLSSINPSYFGFDFSSYDCKSCKDCK